MAPSTLPFSCIVFACMQFPGAQEVSFLQFRRYDVRLSTSFQILRVVSSRVSGLDGSGRVTSAARLSRGSRCELWSWSRRAGAGLSGCRCGARADTFLVSALGLLFFSFIRCAFTERDRA